MCRLHLHSVSMCELTHIFIILFCENKGYIYIYSGVCYNERCYNERMLLRRVFVNKIRMLQRMRRNTIGRRNTRVRTTCRAFPLWLDRQSSSLLSFVRFSHQFSSVIYLFSQCIKVKWINFIYFYTYIFYFVLYFSCLNVCVGWTML